MKLCGLLFCFILGFSFSVIGQDDLLKTLMEEETPTVEKVYGTFKGTRLINGHSVETRSKGVLDVLVSHRFGRVNWGAYQFFGLDQANMRLGLEYGLNDRFNIGVGRNSFMKVFDGFVKYKFFWQEDEGMPLSVVWFSNMSVNSLRTPNLEGNFGNRLGYTLQALVARKFNENLSLQVTPTYVRRNMVTLPQDNKDLLVLGLGGRYKLTPRTSLNMEYFYKVNGSINVAHYNAIAIGVDIETGGHVFQLHFTNAQSMTETGFIPETTGNFFNGDIHFGFNISRTFQLK